MNKFSLIAGTEIKLSLHLVTVNLLGQFVLSDSCLVVHLICKHAARACTAWRLPAWYVLAEQMYHYISNCISLYKIIDDL